MRRLGLSLLLSVCLTLWTAGLALGASALITPYFQSHSHGVASSWTVSWGNYSPYFVVFYYGDGESWTYSGAAAGAVKTHTFLPCSTTQFRQELQVRDDHGGVANDYSYATENGGNPC